MSKTIAMPLPAERVGGQTVKVTEKPTEYVSDFVAEGIQKLFAQTDSVKCVMVTTNRVINLQFIGNGCVANLQISALEPPIPHQAIRRHLNIAKRKEVLNEG